MEITKNNKKTQNTSIKVKSELLSKKSSEKMEALREILSPTTMTIHTTYPCLKRLNVERIKGQANKILEATINIGKTRHFCTIIPDVIFQPGKDWLNNIKKSRKGINVDSTTAWHNIQNWGRQLSKPVRNLCDVHTKTSSDRIWKIDEVWIALSIAFPKHRLEMFYLKTKSGARSQGWHADQKEYYDAWERKEKLEFDRNDVPLSAFLSIEMESTLGIASEWIPGTDICQNNTV